MAEPTPCIHSDAGLCYLRQCLVRGCRRAKGWGHTDGTGKLAGDRVCDAEVGGFCEYIHPCVGLCRKVVAMEHARAGMEGITGS